VRDLLGESDLRSAYTAQQINTERKVALGARVVGCKIGLTSEAVQKQLGVSQPDFGILTDTMQVNEIVPVSWSELMQPKAETEIAFVLKSAPRGELTLESLAATIDYAVAAIEIVGSRISNWNIRVTDTIADNASASHFVLGSTRKRVGEIDLVNCAMQMRRNGEVVSEVGAPLKAGDIILTGALGPMALVQPGDMFEATVSGLGSVQVSFTAD
jgi:2-keto-4-pentenoate hydratase